MSDIDRDSAQGVTPQTILISGSTGLIGTALGAALRDAGHKVVPLLRGTAARDGCWWDPPKGAVSIAPDLRLDTVIHLGGENIGNGRWTSAKKAAIRNSRVDATELLVRTLLSRDQRPRVFIAASAIGLYGNRGADLLTEQSDPGKGFLAEVATAWEAAVKPLTAAGIRTVRSRFGVVLSTKGGALEKLLTPFRLGLGGPVGAGSQYISWISLRDAVRAVRFLLEHQTISGPVNIVAPHPVTNRAFATVLGRALNRPAVVPVPAFALRTMLGEMADELLLSSIRVKPQVLTDAGFSFLDDELELALQRIIRDRE